MNYRIFIYICTFLSATGMALRAEDTPSAPPAPPPDVSPPPPPERVPSLPENEQNEYTKGPKPWHRPMPHSSESRSIDVVESFLEMSPERLAMIRALIERIEQMTPEEKKAMRERLASYRALTDDRRARMMKEFQQIPVKDRLLLRMYWRSLPKEQARAEKQKLNGMPPAEREAYRETLLEKARAAGITLAPPSPPPDINVPPPPELLPPPFPDGLNPPPPPPAASATKEIE